MQDVADAAGVSKGLIHYHFHDKETLLTRLIEWMTGESIDPRRLSMTCGSG
jgi:TetR/AcrR family transcriptional regulator, fatty acid metabolism regulator protein